MEDPQIHDSIEHLVDEEHDLWSRESDGTATDDDRQPARRPSRSRSTSAGTCCASAAPRVDAGLDPDRPRCGGARSSRTTSSSQALVG